MTHFYGDMNEVRFSKFEGCGNSFLVVMDVPGQNHAWSKLSKRILNKNFGIGADGLLVISRGAPFELTIYNADGSHGGMSGNGVRCAAEFLRRGELLNTDTVELNVHGRIIMCRYSAASWKVRMGKANFSPEAVPVLSATELIDSELGVGELLGSAVSMGNPHCVIFVSELLEEEVKEFGPVIETLNLFPERTNVEFVKVCAPNHVKVRVWERGVGETLACGSGACAVVAVASRLGKTQTQVSVQFPGGTLDVEIEPDNEIVLGGPTNFICQGVFEI